MPHQPPTRNKIAPKVKNLEAERLLKGHGPRRYRHRGQRRDLSRAQFLRGL
jgi:hypothetical protein